MTSYSICAVKWTICSGFYTIWLKFADLLMPKKIWLIWFFSSGNIPGNFIISRCCWLRFARQYSHDEQLNSCTISLKFTDFFTLIFHNALKKINNLIMHLLIQKKTHHWIFLSDKQSVFPIWSIRRPGVAIKIVMPFRILAFSDLRFSPPISIPGTSRLNE